MKKIGFSTGAFYKILPRASIETIEMIRNIGCNAIEFSPEFEQLENFTKVIKTEDLKGFEYVSLHTPQKLFELKPDETLEGLKWIEEIYRVLNLNCVVIHPHNFVNFDIFKGFSFPIGIENEDNRKSSGQTVAEMAKILKANNFGMVLDLNHCYVNDNSMDLADSFVKNFSNKIKEVHVSGFTELHDPLYISKQESIIQSILKLDFPFIIESKCRNIEEAKKEFDFVNNLIAN